MAALTYAQLEGAWIAGGGSPATAPIAAAVAKAESGGNPLSHNGNAGTGDNSYGLWQINMLGSMGPARRATYHLASNDALFDPVTNARVAVAMSNNGKNWGPWTTFTSGAYLRYMQNGVPAATVPGGSAAASAAAAGAAAAAPGGGTGVSLAADSTPTPGAADSPCLLGWSGISLPIVGTQGAFCLISKTEARALIGGLLVAAGALIGLVGMVTLIKGFDAVNPTLSGIGAAPGAIPMPTPKTKTKPATGAGTTSGTVSPDEMNNEYPAKRGTLTRPAQRKPGVGTSKRIGGKRALTAAVIA